MPKFGVMFDFWIKRNKLTFGTRFDSIKVNIPK